MHTFHALSATAHRLRCLPLFAVLVSLAVSSDAASPDGFVVWSEGDHENREIKYVKLAKDKGVSGAKQTVCRRGKYSDIQCVISFDGKYVAFARQLQSNNCCYDGPGDYHMFGNYDIYIVRVDGNLPATPKRIGHGYWPSWGDDSDGPTKTLYYSWVPGSGRGNEDLKIMKTTISENGSFTSPKVHIDVPQNSGDGHMQCSPNGRYVAYRTSKVRLYDSKTGRTVDVGGGCHPSWGANSYWLMWARNQVGAISDGRVVHKQSAGLHDYHYGCSQDMKWAIGRIGSSGNDQNTPHAIIFYPLRASLPGQGTTWSLNKGEAVRVGSGTWCDIHVATGPSIGLSSNTRSISLDGSADIKATTGGGLSGDLTWSVSGGGTLSNTSNAGATFTSNGTEGSFTITASAGEVSSSITITVVDPSKIRILINCGGPDVGEWESDQGYASGGDPFTFGGTHDLSGCTDPAPAEVYQTVRHWSHQLDVPVPDGDYLVRIHFTDATGGADRAMTYTIEGETVLSDYNIVQAAGGSSKAVIEEFTVSVSDGDGLRIAADQGSNDAFEAGVEVIAVSSTPRRVRSRPGQAGERVAVQALGHGVYRIEVSAKAQSVSVMGLDGSVVQRFAPKGIRAVRWDAGSLQGTFVVRVRTAESMVQQTVTIVGE